MTFFLAAFTQEEFDFVIQRVVPISIYVGAISLVFTIADSLTSSVLYKGTYNKVSTALITISYIVPVLFIFVISLVSVTSSFKLCNYEKFLYKAYVKHFIHI